MKERDNQGDEENFYAKVGWLTTFFSFGETGFGVDYTRSLNLPTGRDDGYSVGAAAVQHFDEYGTEIYLQYRLHSLDRDVEPSVTRHQRGNNRRKGEVLMGILRTHRRKALWIGALLVALLVIAGCAGIEPYEPRNNREEDRRMGLFSGSEGEFVIFRKADEPETGQRGQQKIG